MLLWLVHGGRHSVDGRWSRRQGSWSPAQQRRGVRAWYQQSCRLPTERWHLASVSRSPLTLPAHHLLSDVPQSAGEGSDLCPEAIAVHPGYGPFALSLGNRIYAITMGHPSMWSWSPAEVCALTVPACALRPKLTKMPVRLNQVGSPWRKEPSPPKGMAQMSGTTLDGVCYIVGQDGCFSFTPATGDWAELPSFPGGDLTAPHVAAHKGKVWVAMDNSSDATAFFSPETQEWTVGPTAPTANGWGGAASIDGKLLLVSGAHMDDLHGRVIFDDRCFVLRE